MPNPGALLDPKTPVERSALGAPTCPRSGCSGPGRYVSWRLTRPKLSDALPELWEPTAFVCLNPACTNRPK